MNFRAISLLFAWLFLAHNAIANYPQNRNIQLSAPIKIPIFLSGNFGELRTGHFHAGIDLKTNGIIGIPVYSSEGGYVSRIKVDASGYGNAIYINHPNGLTTVYGHLDHFNTSLANFTLEQQYKRKSFEVDLYLTPGQFPVEKDQLIAYSGNTGFSGGPHVHFEIRTSAAQIPQNGLQFGFNIADTIPPLLKQLFIYQLCDTNTNLVLNKTPYRVTKSKQGTYTLNGSQPVKTSSHIAFGIEGYDYLNHSMNRCGIYRIELFVDQTEIFSFKIDEVPFSVTRDIKSHMDYEEKIINKISVHKLYREPNNRLKLYKTDQNNGIVFLQDSLPQSITIKAFDVYGNLSVLKCQVQKDEQLPVLRPDSSWQFVSSDHASIIEGTEFQLRIPAKSLYTDVLIQPTVKLDPLSKSKHLRLEPQQTPFRSSATLRLKIPEQYLGLPHNKLIIVHINNQNELSSKAGVCVGNWIETDIGQLGTYSVSIDTLAPKIEVIKFRQGNIYQPGDEIVFKITDNISPIASYNGYIDNKWVLFSYDAKNDILTHTIDKNHLMKTGQKHELKLYVMDEKNNMSVFTSYFVY